MAFKLILSVLAVIIIFACSGGNDNNSNLINIDYIKAQEMIASENPPVIFDVRTLEEFNGELGHLEGARLIPHNLVKDSLDIFNSYEGKNILLVCRTGRRSKIAGNVLSELGIENVYNLRGGMTAWNAEVKNSGS
jgi:rhodanese-related sulfurtransferase